MISLFYVFGYNTKSTGAELEKGTTLILSSCLFLTSAVLIEKSHTSK